MRHFTVPQWTIQRVGQRNPILQIHFGGPQYAALHLRDSYLRFVSGRDVGWGTSVLTMPSYWSAGKLHQRAPIEASCEIVGQDLLVNVGSARGKLRVRQKITIKPPDSGAIRAKVETNVSGDLTLGDRPGEAFRPVFLSSMHVSAGCWDACAAYADTREYGLPVGAWIIPASPATQGRSFGLIGGTSFWKTNAPSVHIALSTPMQIAGWLTPSSNADGDNIGLWAAADTLLRHWEYEIVVNTRRRLP